jgi:signal transduction histidine kinase
MLITFITVTLLILLLVSGLFLTFIISSRQRLKQLVVLSETKLAFEKELRTIESEVTENIMSQFARELHDNIGQLLTALHIQVENQKLDHPEMAESFRPTEIYVSEINQQLRLLSRTLNNDYLGNIGLTAAVELEAERLRGLKRFTVHYSAIKGPAQLPKDQELVVFRIFQEIVQNALRHSSAKNLWITIDTSETFRLEIRDDGKGFDKETMLASGKASGLRNIIKRADLAGLKLNISSTAGEGSLFIIEKVSNFG